MALKLKLTAAEFEALTSAEIKAEYWKDGDGYTLKVDGLDDPAELKRALDREKAEAKRFKEENDGLKAADKARKDKEESERDENARKSGDWASLEESWKTKEAETKKKHDAEIKQLTNHLNRVLVDNQAAAIAAEISTAPKLVQDHIAKRLKVELTDDGPITRVLDANGKPSALSLDDLRKEFVDNADYKGVIKDTLASGGGANKRDAGNPGGGAPLVPPAKPENLAKADPKTLAAAVKAKAEARITELGGRS